MRVVAGALSGRRLRAPTGLRTRPTADRVREALFSMLGPVEGLRALDLFAGSGALGIEALSRGALEAVFVDSDRRAVEVVRSNLAALGLDAAVHRRDAIRYLEGASGRPGFDLVFCDPPYDSAARLAGALSRLLPTVLAPEAVIVFESHKRSPLELSLPLLRERAYGDTRIALYGG